MDLGIIDRAGLAQREFAELAGLSRVTVNRWIMEERSPQLAKRQQAEAIIARLEYMLSQKQLPLHRKIVGAGPRMVELKKLFNKPAV